ncbi:MAG: TIGR04053 family radical SAM/SPASM domain-containing protein [Chloroflexi bacterium]|nr:TIGR04053 family radical SAM/SPASM domain-containing protein [Chloroflexota bacterium]
MQAANFNLVPFTIAWEVTRACAFACKHCRADAIPRRDPLELTTAEARTLIDRLAAFGSPILVFTGGDPMMRRDLFELIAYATEKGLRCSLTPTATTLPTVERLRQAAGAGIRRVALSLDGPSTEVHDEFRQVPGSWERTMQILRNAGEVGLSVQVNTTVTTFNVDLLSEMVPFIEKVGAVQWSVFFLVPTGRAQAKWLISPKEHERVFNWLYDLSQRAPFDIKATAAPMYRRVAVERRRAESGGAGEVTFQGAGFQYADGLNRPRKGVNDGNGFLFISHTGEIMPSGFLPISAGNVRKVDVVETYRHHELFATLRNYDLLKGKCRICEYREFCGGQRGRAYGVTGDYMASDPSCVYLPAGVAA